MIKEFFKVIPYVLILFTAGVLFTDYSQFHLTFYYVSMIAMSLLIFRTSRKFMYPNILIEEYCKSALNEKNLAAAFIVFCFFSFEIILICILVSLLK